MTRPKGDALRPGEVLADTPVRQDAAVQFIGRIATPWPTRDDCPRQGSLDGPLCRITVFAPWHRALAGLDAYPEIEVFYWLDRARRDVLLQSPRADGQLYGAFALRSPVRANPIGMSLVRLEAIEGDTLLVRGLDCIDGTPLIDLKPDRCAFTPKAPK